MAKFLKRISLLPYNTFGIEADARYLSTWYDIDSLLLIVQQCKWRKLKFHILGGGSNTILTGKFRGMIIHPVSNRIILQNDLVVADAGVVWDDLVGWAVDKGLVGLENLSYIPGTVGASPVQNIGAYGVEAGDLIDWVEYLDVNTMTIERIDGSHCKFGYRDSIFKSEMKNQAIITRVAFRIRHLFDPEAAKLDYGDLRSAVEKMDGGITLENIRTAVTEIRRSKLPDPTQLGNAGSFFKNPIVTKRRYNNLLAKFPDMPSYAVPEGCKIPAGWLIERAGWKGFREGGVGVHDRQALVLVNHGGATAKEVMQLARRIKADVKAKFGIDISMEVTVL